MKKAKQTHVFGHQKVLLVPRSGVCKLKCVNGHSFLSSEKEKTMAKKKEKIPDIQGELIDQLIRESGGP
ncbi:MAG TPA: hypothetical protein VN631_10300, partial [Negativicutes bacterium]|nr:hypothetical protein [Negativicutes bacterium]